jgi:hypothetical protein
MPSTGDKTLKFLKKKCIKYSKRTDSNDYVYVGTKFNDIPYVIVLKKRPDTKTDEDRKHIYDPLYAKFRADNLDIIKTINVLNPKYEKIRKLLRIGTVSETDVKEYLSKEKTNLFGISYFKDIEPAFMSCITSFIGDWKVVQVKEWYDNGRIKKIESYVNGIQVGIWRTWHINGELAEEVNYVDGKIEGEWKKWYDNGQMSQKVFCKKGRFSGKFTSWYRDGKIYQEANYKNGKLFGQRRKWYSNGNICEEENYVDEELAGQWRLWSETGELLNEIFYS